MHRVRRVTPSPKGLLLLAAFASTVHLVACAGESGTGTTEALLTACKTKVAWQHATTENCVKCNSAARLQECECPAVSEYSGKCADEYNAAYHEPTCTEAIDKCVTNCKADCDCVERCYANAPACRDKSAARDTCLVDVCAAACR